MSMDTVYKINTDIVTGALNSQVVIKNSHVWTPEEIKNLLKTKDNFLIKSLIKLYKLQTEDEKDNDVTVKSNGVGFDAFDAPNLTAIAKQIIKCKIISSRQLTILRKKLPKYSKQITKIANGNIIA